MRQSKSRKLAKEKADRYFSKYVRKKAADYRGLVQCITCKKWMHWKRIHAGHFMSRRYAATRYDERNVAPQCTACNTFNQGRQFEFGQWIDKTYGPGTAAELERKSKMKCHRKQSDFEWLACEFQQKLKRLSAN